MVNDLATQPNPKLKDYPLLSAHDSLFSQYPVWTFVNLDVWDSDISWPPILIPLFQPFMNSSEELE
jgi:hypothetical protein